ncbi:MAG: winged helix-turn-helix domain-containing protein, partial [Pseudonocardia sp.]|nr:winged helix-turn-helix domain-containing protein [Pseudonocardia sp.]
PLSVDRDGEAVALGGARLVAALSLLLVNAGRVVSPDALGEAMWDAGTGPRSSSTLDSHVWRLRNVLEPGRARGEPATVLLREAGGYRLVAAPERVDSMRFAVLADETLGLLTGGQAERAVRRAEEALALWRGRPFGDAADASWARPAVTRLEELRALVRERHVEALLAVGDPGQALVELTSALADDPLRERLWAQRMLAYHRSRRTDRALATYREARTLFIDEIGIEPSGELRALQSRILAEDPTLAAPRTEPPRPAAEVHLPTRLNRLIGRDRECGRVAALTADHRLVTVVGAAGCGKTRLALAAARTAAAHFPDGVWAIDLTAASAGEQVVATMTSALGLALPVTGSARDALRSFGRDRRMLLLLDNCEHLLDPAADIVDELLADSTELAVLATSRVPLDVDGEQVFPLDPLPVPAPGGGDHAGPAIELFLERLAATGLASGSDDLDGADLERVARICRAVDGVPLAIELAAARARAYSLDEIVAQVTADASTLGRVGRGARGHHGTVRSAVEQSYRTLAVEEAQLHRALSVIPGPVTPAAAAALVDRPVPEVRALLARLVHCSLLVPLGPIAAGRPSRFTQLATVRGHAAHAAADESPSLVATRDRWVAALATSPPPLGDAREPDWFAALDDDLAALRATLQHCLADAPSALGVQVASRLGLYWYYRGMMVEARHWQERATEPDAAPLDRTVVRLMLGGSLCMASRRDLGVPLIREAWEIVRGTPEAHAARLGEALGILSGALFVAGDAAMSARNAELVAAIADATGDPTIALMAGLAAVLATTTTATPPDVIARASDVYDSAVAAGNTFAAWMASDAAADAALAARDVTTGMRWSDRMVAQHRTLRVREGPSLLEVRADLLTLAGDAPAAVRLYSAARAHNQRAGMQWPLRTVTSELMEKATGALDRVAFEEEWQAGAHLTLEDLEPL